MIWGEKEIPHAYVMYHKNTKERTWVWSKIGKHITHSLINDLDGGLPFYPFWKASENKLIQPITVLHLKEFLRKNKIDTQHILDLNGRKQLEQLVANAKDTDNPILMVVTLK